MALAGAGARPALVGPGCAPALTFIVALPNPDGLLTHHNRAPLKMGRDTARPYPPVGNRCAGSLTLLVDLHAPNKLPTQNLRVIDNSDSPQRGHEAEDAKTLGKVSAPFASLR